MGRLTPVAPSAKAAFAAARRSSLKSAASGFLFSAAQAAAAFFASLTPTTPTAPVAPANTTRNRFAAGPSAMPKATATSSIPSSDTRLKVGDLFVSRSSALMIKSSTLEKAKITHTVAFRSPGSDTRALPPMTKNDPQDTLTRPRRRSLRKDTSLSARYLFLAVMPKMMREPGEPTSVRSTVVTGTGLARRAYTPVTLTPWARSRSRY